MSRPRRTAAPWIALAAAVVGLLSAGEFTPGGLERVFRAALHAISSLNTGEQAPGRAPRGERRAEHRGDTAPLAGRARIIDGDTLDLGETRIRLRGIDALEHDQRCTRRGQGGYDCGQQAREELVELIGNAPVTCTPDGTETYGRVVATCTVPRREGGVLELNAAMVRSGFAFDCTRFSKGAYLEQERAAKSAGSGAWAGRFDFPWAHRERVNACGRD